MTDIVDPEVLEPTPTRTPPPRRRHLEAVDASTKEDFAAWGMMVGRQEGRFLEMLVFAPRPPASSRSAPSAATRPSPWRPGWPRAARIISLEIDPHHAEVARGNIAAAATRATSA